MIINLYILGGGFRMGINDYDGIADLYDIYVPATFDIEFFVDHTKNVSGEVLELMSGTGRVSIPLIEAGVRLTCVDISAELNAIFKKKLQQLGLQAEVFQMDVCELDLEKQFEMVIIPFSSFAHITKPADQRKALESIWQHLKPGGTFICTLGNPEVRKKAIDGQLHLFRTYPLPDIGGKLLLWIRENFSPKDEKVVEAQQFYEEYDAGGNLIKERLLELSFRLSEREEFGELISEIGFRVQALYGGYSGAEYEQDSPMMIWVLEKPVS
jgi:SAM-dependent methyltransferase